MRRKDRELTEKADIEAILAKADCCHLALSDGRSPYLVTLNYGWDWSDALPTFWFHSARAGRKLDIIARNSAACLGIDTGHELVTGPLGCDWGMKYSSAVAFGSIAVVEDNAEKRKALDRLMLHHSGQSGFEYDDRIFAMTAVLRMDVTEITGKRKE